MRKLLYIFATIIGLENALTRRDAPDIIRDNFVDYFRHLASENNNNITAGTDGRITVE